MIDPDARRRVAVTGMGMVTSLGSDVDSNWRAVLEGRSGVDEIRQFDSRAFPVRIASEVDLATLPVPPDLDPQRLARAARFGLVALDEAWRGAGIGGNGLDAWRAGVCIGCSSFPVLEDRVMDVRSMLVDDRIDRAAYLAMCRDNPHLLVQRDMGAVSALLSSRYGLQGPSLTVQAACTSATQAVGESMHMIRSGAADLMVSGGTDSLVSLMGLAGFTLLGALSRWQGPPSEASRPFDRKRDGFVLGEGAGILILEEMEHARGRGAPILAEMIGYGASSDGYRFTDVHPEGTGAIRCMRAALADAAIAKDDVRYINAHGTSTRLNDKVETLAIRAVLGGHADRVPVSSTKSQLGHLICGAGAVELIFTVLATRHGLLPPTINLEHPDPECDLDYVPNRCRHADLPVAMSNSFGFGGQNGTLVVRRAGVGAGA
jgi:3-oxoacyl-[acyl-carrier-protein] synthase II